MTFTEFLSVIGDIVTVLGVIVLLSFVWLWLAVRHTARQEDRELNTLVKALDEEKLIALRVETSNDQFLCYNARTDDFVCQGRSLIEIKQRFKQRFPDKDAAIADGDENALQVLRQQIKEFYENSDSVRSPS